MTNISFEFDQKNLNPTEAYILMEKAIILNHLDAPSVAFAAQEKFKSIISSEISENADKISISFSGGSEGAYTMTVECPEWINMKYGNIIEKAMQECI